MDSLFREVRRPGAGIITDAAEADVSPDGRYVVFSGTISDTLEGLPTTCICLTDLENGETRILTSGRYSDRSPKSCPNGRCVAFLSARTNSGDFQLYLLDPTSEQVTPTIVANGWVEYLHWAPDGDRLV
jgi:Tol biopolymer transport system component